MGGGLLEDIGPLPSFFWGAVAGVSISVLSPVRLPPGRGPAAAYGKPPKTSERRVFHALLWLPRYNRCAEIVICSRSLKTTAAVPLLGSRLTQVNEYFRTSNPRVYAVGDVVGPPGLASSAQMGGRAVSSYLFKDKLQKLKQSMLETSADLEVRPLWTGFRAV